MVEIPVKSPGGGYVHALVDDKDAALVRMYTWHLTAVDGRVCAPLPRLLGKQRQTSLPRLLLGLQKDDEICVLHHDGDKMNCQRKNLKLANRSQVMQACTPGVGLRGASWSRHNNRWRAQVTQNGKQNHIGYYETAEEAAAAASEWRRKNLPFSRDARSSNTLTIPEGSHGQ
jgi:AP2 domain